MLNKNEYMHRFGFIRKVSNSKSPLGIFKLPLSVIDDWYNMYVNEGIEPEDWNDVD